ncbi:MAG: hypothetical protein U0133_21415 [Gemmatimonadales bacterium]
MDRLTRPNPPGSSRFFLSIILAIGAVFVVLGFVSATDYTPSPVRDTVLVAGGTLLVLTGVIGLKSPTYSLSGSVELSPARLYAQLGVALLGLGVGSTLLLGPGWDTAAWLLPGVLALHRSYLLYRFAKFAKDKGIDPSTEFPE